MERFVRLATHLGTTAIVFGFARLHAILNEYDFTKSNRVVWTAAYLVILYLAAYGTGIPDLLRGRRRTMAAALAAPAIGAVGISIAQLVVGDSLLPRVVVFGSVIALVPWFVLCTAVASGGRALAEERDRVFVVGDRSEGHLLRSELSVRPERSAQVVGMSTMSELANAPAGTLSKLVVTARASVLVLSREAQLSERVVHEVALMHESGIRVRTLALFHEQWLGKLPVSELERVSLMFDIREVHRAIYSRIARVFDVLVAVLLAPVLFVALPFVLVGNCVANRGPLLYGQMRVGKNGKTFKILKFRTMRPAADGLVNEWTSEDDPRITSFGRALRVTHLDELPQVVNIFLGHLSIVGPRPEQPHYVKELSDKLPFYNLRHLVRPGLTGWAQVKYGYAGSESDALEKLQYEFFYLRHQSLSLDLRILMRTIRRVLRASGR